MVTNRTALYAWETFRLGLSPATVKAHVAQCKAVAEAQAAAARAAAELAAAERSRAEMAARRALQQREEQEAHDALARRQLEEAARLARIGMDKSQYNIAFCGVSGTF